MATGSDALLDHLLFQVAISGTQGLGIKALSDACVDFNARLHVDQEKEDDENDGDADVDILFSSRPPGSGSDARPQASDPQHLERIWTWLVDHPDVSVHQTDPGDATTYDESSPLTPVLKEHANERLRTTDNRTWHALTDHDVDWKRIPKLEFTCLQVIASAGPQGILQPDVTRLTGQDKRSVPKRTESLATKGYITKEQCLGGGIKTSLLRLKKFSQQAQNSTYIEVTTESANGDKSSTRRMVHYDTWYSEVIANLQKHGNIMAYEDLRKEMGIHGLKWETRALHRCMRRLDRSGCIQRLKARQDTENAPDPTKGQETEENVEDDSSSNAKKPKKIRWVRCIKLVREPTEKDKEAFTSTAGLVFVEKTEDQDDSDADVDADADADGDDEFAEVDEGVTTLTATIKAPDREQRLPTQWQPSLHHTQFMFHLINSSGTRGVTTTELANLGMGHFWRRPLDELMGRLTDVWTVSQPIHLRHLAVIRDTAFLSRTSHYVFRSYDNFKKLVENGEAVWEAIGVNTVEIEKQPELDAWGFPKVKSTTIVGPEGFSNIVHCKNTAGKTKSYFKRNLFESHDVFVPPTYNSRNVIPSTPRSMQGDGRPQSPLDEDTQSMTSAKKSYKKDLWKMNPKRVEAELKEWKKRARRAAESRARAEFGHGSKPTAAPDVSQPNKRRKRQTTDHEVSAVAISEPAANHDTMSSAATSPTETHRGHSNADVSANNDGQPHGQSRAKEPSVQPDTERKRTAEEDAGFEKRVSEIEHQILDKANPGVYVNPPGSGQMKNSTFLPRGRPSRYLIAVFKSEKLRTFNWFNSNEQESGPPSATRSPSVVVETAAAEANDSPQPTSGESVLQHEANPLSKSTLESGDRVVIRNGTRAQKRKARDSLRERVTKRLATESSFEQPQPSPVKQVAKRKQPAMTVEKSAVPRNVQEVHKLPSSLDSAASQPTVKFDHRVAVPTTKAGGELSPVVDPLNVQSLTAASTTESETKASSAQQPTDELSQHQTTPIATDADVHMEEAPAIQSQRDDPPVENLETQEIIDTSVIADEDVTATPTTTEGESTDQMTSPATQKKMTHPLIIPSATLKSGHGKQAKSQKKVGVGRSGGIVSFNREKLVMELIHKYGGVFGGDRELFYPFITEWEKSYGRRPDRHTLDRVLVTLVEDGRLQRMSFTFQAANGSVITKSIVMEPGVDPGSSEVQDLKQKIMEYHPLSYLPPSIELAPDLRKHVEADVRNVYVKRPPDVPTQRNYFPEDSSTFVNRLYQPQKVKLGMTEATLQSGVSARRRRREEEARRQERYMKAQLGEEEEIDEAQAALQTDFQLTSYQHDPERAFVDRGPHGRRRLAKLQRWGAEEHTVPERALGLLTANEQRTAEQNSSDAAAASTFGVLVTSKRWQKPFGGPQDRPVRETPNALSHVLQNSSGMFRVIEALSLSSPYQRFHAQSGTFSTDPVIITTSSKPSRFGFDGEQMPMSLADIFQRAGEEASLLQPPQTNAQGLIMPGQYSGQLDISSSSRALAALGSNYPLAANQAKLRKQIIRPLPEYKAYQPRVAVPRATRTGIFSMSEKEEQRLIYAVVAVRTLTGGLEQHTNWGLVHQVFHYKFDPNYCRHRWGLLRSKHGGTSDKLQVEFRKAFIEAYENGEVPGIDFVEPENYDWVAIVDWAEANLSAASLPNDLPELPKSRQVLESRYDVKDSTDIYNVSREDFWAAHVTHLRREELATNWTYSRPLANESRILSGSEDLLLAKSWVRANVVTPDAVYDSNAAHNRLVQVENDLPKALEQLLGAKIIRMENKGRTIPGRNYDISDQVLTMFKRPWDATFLRSAAAYKAVIDKEFAEHGKMVINYHATDPQMTAMTNLVSAGRAKVVPLLPAVDHSVGAPWPRLTKWGFTEGNYKTVHMDKSRLHFGLELHPTADYTPGHPATPLPIPLTKKFPGEIGPRLPLWTDINGDLIPVYWDMVLMATLWLLAFRPGLTAETMARGAYKGKLWDWELDMFLGWAEGSGYARRIGAQEGTGEPGWTADEWWWVAFGGGE